MNSDAKGSPSTAIEAPVAGRLWGEYQYRHDLCWRLVFKLTGAAVVLAILPYAKPDVTKTVGGWITPVPLIGIVLTGFGIYMMRAELARLDAVRTLYRTLQAKELGLPNQSSGFTRGILLYLQILLGLELANLLIVLCVWLPILKRGAAPTR